MHYLIQKGSAIFPISKFMNIYKYLFGYSILLLSNFSAAQPFYNNLYNYMELKEFDREIHFLNDSNFITIGSASVPDKTNGIIIREVDENGSLLWEDFITNDSLYLFLNWTHTSILADSILLIFATAQKVESSELVLTFPYFIKYNLNQKKVLSTQFYPFEIAGRIYTIVYHNDGYFYGGGIEGNIHDQNLLLMKIDTTGKLIWQKELDYGSFEQINEIESFGEDLIITGIHGSRTAVNSFMAKIDTSGQVKQKVEPISFGPNGVIQSEIVGDQIYFTTVTPDKIEDNETQYLAQFNANLKVVWDTLIPQTSLYKINFRRMEVLNNEIILAGNIKGATQFTNNKIWSYATSWSLEGQFNWEHVYQYDPTFTHHIDDIEAAPNGDLIFMGTVFDRSDQYLWLFRTDSQGCGTVQDTCYYTLDAYFGLDTMVSVFETTRPNFNLVEVLGNPFKEQLLLNSLSYKNFDILIYDVQGKQVYEGILGSNLNLNTANWQCGVYVMQVMNEGQLLGVKKLVRE